MSDELSVRHRTHAVLVVVAVACGPPVARPDWLVCGGVRFHDAGATDPRRCPSSEPPVASWSNDGPPEAVRAIGERYRAGELAAAPAAAAVSRELRAFLRAATGASAEYMQVDAIAAGELASAAPVLTELIDAQFNADTVVDVGAVSDSAEELIHSWS